MNAGRSIRVGEVYRYARPYDSSSAVIDGLPNYFYCTHTSGMTMPLLESGINPIAKVEFEGVVRLPAILISSSPHKIGSEDTPWQDHFDPEHGHVRYFGDNKESGKNPSYSRGNARLLEQYNLHKSSEEVERRRACPVLFFKRVRQGQRHKGNLEFQGYGVIHKAERVTQFRKKGELPFTNYVYEFVLFDLKAENELFCWDWISARRNDQMSEDAVMSLAPKAWQRWVKEGPDCIELVRRRVVKLLTSNRMAQRPADGSREDLVLRQIYSHYDSKKHHFEALASGVASRILGSGGGRYLEGWITQVSGDGGADFVGRLDLGVGFSTVKLVVLGQAKCESITTPTNGNSIARTVARLRRGWIGVYVTTSYFSEQVQAEVLEDKYPILLVNGLRVAQEVAQWSHEAGLTVEELLLRLSASYDERIGHREPEQIIYD
jgi:hypothetical protein